MRIRKRWAVITFTLMTSIVTSCSLDNNDDGITIVPGPFEMTSLRQELVNHSNDFAFNLLRQIIDSKSNDEKNQSIIVSPISITYALGMLNNGATGNTQKQINDVLGFGNASADEINDFCLKMLETAPTLDPKTNIIIANNIYMNKGYILKPEFIKKANTYYNAYPETRDFNDGETMDVINKWASDNTEKMITKILDNSTFNPDAVSYLLNAIYFKGEWTTKFNKDYTTEEQFTLAGNTPKTALLPMMHMSSELEYAEIDGYQVLRLPYGNKSFRMTILLPIVQDNEMNALPAVPSAGAWSKINKSMGSYLVDLKLPRFDITTDIDLLGIMSNLGMPDAFNPDKADFSNFCNTSSYIAMMKQVAAIKLDEEGTEASAVTIIRMDNTVYTPDPKQVYFHADHPFIYIISETTSNAIFFIGQYTGL